MNKEKELQLVWEETYAIRSYEVDPSARVTVPVMCRFMQETAWHHAESLSFGFHHLQTDKLIWVLSRQKVKMLSYPRWGDTIRVVTWPKGMDRLYYYRDFKFLDAAGKVLGMANTVWFMVDIATRRPRPTDTLPHIPLNSGDSVLEQRLGKLREVPASPDGGYSLGTHFLDTDVNGHVNNVNYLEWILRGMSDDFLKGHVLDTVELSYLAEASLGDVLDVNVEGKSPLEYVHNIVCKESNREMFRARTLWNKVS